MLRESWHPVVVAIGIEPLGFWVGDHGGQPFAGAIAGEVGSAPQFSFIMEAMAVGAAETGCDEFASFGDRRGVRR